MRMPCWLLPLHSCKVHAGPACRPQVLSSSNAVAAAVVNLDVVPCRCGLGSSGGGDAAGMAGALACCGSSAAVGCCCLSDTCTCPTAVILRRGRAHCPALHLNPNPAGSAARFSDLTGWQAAGLRLLLHYDPAAGLAALLEPDRRLPAWPAGAMAAGGAAAERAQVGIPGGRRTGYRQPRPARPPSGPQPPQLAGSKRLLPHAYG